MLGIHSLSITQKRTAQVQRKELGVNLWVHLVEDSPSVLSLGRLCNELDCSYSRPLGGTPKVTEGKRVIECKMKNFIPVVAVTKQQEVASKVISPAEGNIERDEKITEKSSSVEAHSSDVHW